MGFGLYRNRATCTQALMAIPANSHATRINLSIKQATRGFVLVWNLLLIRTWRLLSQSFEDLVLSLTKAS